MVYDDGDQLAKEAGKPLKFENPMTDQNRGLTTHFSRPHMARIRTSDRLPEGSSGTSAFRYSMLWISSLSSRPSCHSGNT